MRRRRSGPDDLLVFRADGSWHDVRSEEVNAYLQEKAGEEFSAKDFRTWHGTALAAVELAREKPASPKGGAEGAIRAAIERVAEPLGNTLAVCAAPTSIRACSTASAMARRSSFRASRLKEPSRPAGRGRSSAGFWS